MRTLLLAATTCLTAFATPAWAADPVAVDSYSLGHTPNGLVSGEDSRFVISAGDNGLRVVDLLTFEAVTDFTDSNGATMSLIDVDGTPKDLAITGGERPDIVTINDEGTVTAFFYSHLADNLENGENFIIVQSQLVQTTGSLVAIAADPDSDLVWIADNNTQTVYQMDTKGGSNGEPAPTGVDVVVGNPMRAMVAAVTNVGLKIYVTTSNGLIATVNNGLTVLPALPNSADLIDITDATVNNETHLYVLDATNNQVHDYNTTGNILVASNDLPGGTTPVAVSTLGFGNRDLIAVSFSNPNEVRLYDAETWTLEYGPFSLSGAAGPLVGQPVGYLFAASGNNLELFTGNPFLTGVSVDPDPVVDPGVDFTFRFTSNLDVDWELYTGGQVLIGAGSVTNGTQRRTGTASAGVEEVVTIPGSELALTEGITPFHIVATETSTGFAGHGSGELDFDLPPDAVDGFEMGFGNGRVFVRWKIPNDTDIASYEVHFGTDTAASNGLPGLSSPVSVPQPDPAVPGRVIEKRLEPVANGTTVYAYVVAVDEGGNESAPTGILSATAQETQGVCAQSDCSKACAVVAPGRDALPLSQLALALMLVLGGILLIHKRKTHLLMVALAGTALLAATPRAFAQETGGRPTESEASEAREAVLRESPKWATFQLGGGVYLPDNDLIKDVYGDVNAAGDLRVSALLFSILDVGASVGFQQWSGHGVGTSDGSESDDLFRLTTIPITATALARIDILKEQPVVPYAGGGFVFVDYNERDVYADQTTRGNDTGVVAIGGLMILLDMLEPGRAADADRYWGVNDFYLDLQASRFIFDDKGLDLSGWRFTANVMFEM